MLRDIFSIRGFPKVMVSDNAAIFTSDKFKLFGQQHSIFQKFIAPGHPATNGLAEQNVLTLKNRLKSMSAEPMTLSEKEEIMLPYRSTPLANGKTLVEMYLLRPIQISLDTIRPYKDPGNAEIIKKAQLKRGRLCARHVP